MNKYCYSQGHSPQVVFRDNSFLQRWLQLGGFARLLMVKFTSNEEMSNDAPYNYVSVTTSPILCMNNVLVLLHPATEFIIRLARQGVRLIILMRKD